MTTLSQLWERGVHFLGVPHAIMGGAMTWVSERELVSALSNAGGFGVLASGSLTPETLSGEIQATRQKTKNPFGVNVITMHPKFQEQIHVCVQARVSHVVLAGGLPKVDTIRFLKEHGVKVLCFAPSLPVARKLVRSGADALILEGAEAGGHIGPVSTTVLAQEILPHVKDVPVFIAGGIGHGEAIVSYLHMGASGCQLGTRFACAQESIAHPHFKEAFIRANARDAMPSPQIDPRFPVIPVRALENDATKNFITFQKEVIQKYQAQELSLQEAQLAIEHYWAGALRRAVIDGDVTTGSLMAGQSVGMVQAVQSAQEIVDELVLQAKAAISRNQPLYS